MNLLSCKTAQTREDPTKDQKMTLHSWHRAQVCTHSITHSPTHLHRSPPQQPPSRELATQSLHPLTTSHTSRYPSPSLHAIMTHVLDHLHPLFHPPCHAMPSQYITQQVTQTCTRDPPITTSELKHRTIPLLSSPFSVIQQTHHVSDTRRNAFPPTRERTTTRLFLGLFCPPSSHAFHFRAPFIILSCTS